MILTRYKVQNFKSVKDSGWITCSDVTTLVGVNEAGKSNLLLALWKLNPVSGGKIDILHDAPVSKLTTIRNETETTPFITAEFEVTDDDLSAISEEYGAEITNIDSVIVTRYYDGHRTVSYPNGKPELKIETDEVDSDNSEDEEDVAEVILDGKKLAQIVVNHMPKFVYYSNYGNLSTRLYLPHVTTWLKGGAVAGIEKSDEQIRTMSVLFKFVDLQPEEIQELGLDPKDMAAKRVGSNVRNPNYKPNEEEIQKAEKAKEERTILLQSAGTKLTKEFADWWKQGNYKFRFNADGDYFTIWVSDGKRPDEVSLDQRSTGLQWFISFFLIFLVESKYQHKNAILLLDEAGLTLHPKAQKDLSKFFNSLSQENQIIHTTHSPFIDTNNIDRCKVVYVDADGYTVASANLRDSDDKLNEQSIYAVHAALGLSVSDILFQGCKPIIVEGPSDQIYLSAIKQVLIAEKKFSPKEECIFVPSGGVRGIQGVVSLLGGKQGKLPIVIVDSDKSGKDAKTKLTSGLYKDCKENILEVATFRDVDNAEVEDLIPLEFLKKGIGKLFESIDEDDDQFEDVYDATKPIIPQIEEFARSNGIELEHGYKVQLAKAAKARILKAKGIDAEIIKSWKKLFDKFITK